MNRFRRFWYLTRREKLFFFEACTWLMLSTLSVKTIAFRHIESCLHRWNARERRRLVRSDGVEADIKLVDLSVSRAAKVLPLNSLCLGQSIAKLIMLRRRGIPTVLFAGVKFLDDASFVAHAWVRAGDSLLDPSSWSENTEFTVLVKIGQELSPDLLCNPC